MKKSDFVILNSFDRSGSSAISRTLSTHPDVELIMQPFNSGFMRKGKHRPMEESPYLREAVTFFDHLEKNFLCEQLIDSHWHKEYSTTKKYVPGKIHLVKTTMNHLAQRFMKERYPAIEVWGIWRDPYEIIHSLQKNNFDKVWYRDALTNIQVTVANEEILQSFTRFFKDDLTSSQKLSLIFSVHSYFFFYFLDKNKLIEYDSFRENPNKSFSNFSIQYGLDSYDFTKYAATDLNITGKAYSKDQKKHLDPKIREEIEPIMQSLMRLMENKFNIAKN